MRISKYILDAFSCFLKVKPFGVLASIDIVVSVRELSQIMFALRSHTA